MRALEQHRKPYNLDAKGNNAIGNQFLARLRGQRVVIRGMRSNNAELRGTLDAWDPFTFALSDVTIATIRWNGHIETCLLTRAPGMIISAVQDEPTAG